MTSVRDPRVLAVAVVAYTLLIMVWFLSISAGSRQEPKLDEALVKLSGWPTAIALVGLLWTALLVATVLVALRAPCGTALACMAACTLSAVAVQQFIPPWFREMGYFGISTSEFTDAFLIVAESYPAAGARVCFSSPASCSPA